MSRKRCIRKHYDGKANTIARAMAGAAIMPTEVQDQLRTQELRALEAFRTGTAAELEWNILADMCNICETMARSGIGPEALEPCMRAQEALGQAHRRKLEHGRIAMSGPELQAMRDTYEFHHLQRTAVSWGQYVKAYRNTANRIRSAAPDTKVMIQGAP